VPAPFYAPVDKPDEGDTPAGIPLKHRLLVIARNLPAIAIFVAVCTYATSVISHRLTPIYSATATIDVDRRAPTGVVGQDTSSPTAPADTEQFLNTQVRLIQSDSVLRPVLDSFKLSKVSGDVGFPSLKITRPPSTFLILITYSSPDPQRAAAFVNAVAQSYIYQTYNIRYKAASSQSAFMTQQIQELRDKMEKSSVALADFGKEIDMIRPEEANGIVSAQLLQLNSEYTSAQADRVKKEAAFQSLKDNQLEPAEVSAQGEPLRRLVARLEEAKERFSDADRQYGDRHPEYNKAKAKVNALTADLEQAKAGVLRRAESEYKQALNREAILKQQVTDTRMEFAKVNSRSVQYEILRREAESDRKIYEELANRIKESGINSGFQNGSIRLADPAVASQSPVYPKIKRNVELAFILSLFLGIAAALAADSINSTLRSVADVERTLGAHVVGVLPPVKKWDGGWTDAADPSANKPHPHSKPSKSAVQLAAYQDGILSLRNSIMLGDFSQPIHSVVVTSAAPCEGKTTTAVHLAIAHAIQRHKTLLIDCDLRRPSVRSLLSLPNGFGLSHALADESGWRDQILRSAKLPKDLDVLVAGTPSRSHADLIGHYLPQILKEAGAEYDLIIVDSPPILGFPEPLQLAAAVDGVILVALAGKADHKDIEVALNSLHRLRANMIGIVLNQLKRNSRMDSYAYGRYAHTA
jgi:succinoglycan biosynthesis transport protein ExoP